MNTSKRVTVEYLLPDFSTEMSSSLKREPVISSSEFCRSYARSKNCVICVKMRKDFCSFTPFNFIERHAPYSVSEHISYTKMRPDRLPGVGFILHLDKAKHQQLGVDRSVCVQDSVFVSSEMNQLKIEGVGMQRIERKCALTGDDQICPVAYPNVARHKPILQSGFLPMSEAGRKIKAERCILKRNSQTIIFAGVSIRYFIIENKSYFTSTFLPSQRLNDYTEA